VRSRHEEKCGVRCALEQGEPGTKPRHGENVTNPRPRSRSRNLAQPRAARSGSVAREFVANYNPDSQITMFDAQTS
jgi:hypothetical protein